MPCDSVRSETAAEREARIKREKKRLMEKLRSRYAKAVVGRNGALAFEGRTPAERRDLSDVCAYRRILAGGGSEAAELRKQIAIAEGRAGRKLSAQAIGSGLHSHDGGKSWGRD